MKKDPAAEGIKHLKKIEGELGEIKENTGSWSGWFIRGIMQGAGIIVGTIVGLVALGWLLSILGFVPGLSELADYLRDAVERIERF